MAIDLYATEAPMARYTSEPGMRKVGEMTLELPPGWATKVSNRYEYSVEVSGAEAGKRASSTLGCGQQAIMGQKASSPRPRGVPG